MTDVGEFSSRAEVLSHLQRNPGLFDKAEIIIAGAGGKNPHAWNIFANMGTQGGAEWGEKVFFIFRLQRGQ